jgi:hypothetical protein
MYHDEEKAEQLHRAHEEASKARDAVVDEFAGLIDNAEGDDLKRFAEYFDRGDLRGEFEDLSKALRRLRYAQRDHKAASDAYLAALTTNPDRR